LNKETVIRTLLAGAIIVALMWGWQYLEPYLPGGGRKAVPAPVETPAPPTPAQPSGEKPATETPAQESPAPPKTETPPETVAESPIEGLPVLGAVGAKEAAAEPTTLGSVVSAGDYEQEVAIEQRGAAVKRLTLARRRFFKTVADRRLPADQRAAMDLIDPAEPEAGFAIPELAVKLKDSDAWRKVDLSSALWRVEPRTGPGESATLSVDVREQGGPVLLTVRKTFTLHARQGAPTGDAVDMPQYEMRMDLEFTARDARVDRVTYVLQGPPVVAREDRRTDFRHAVFGKWVEGRVEVEQVLGSGVAKLAAPGPELAWMGQTDKYFAVIVIPLVPTPDGAQAIPESAPPAGTFAGGAKASTRGVTEHRKEVLLPVVQLVSKETPLSTDGPVTHAYTIFAGPKDAGLLETYYTGIGLDGLVQWTQCCVPIPGLSYISRVLLAVVEAFYSVVGNYGVAIIMLVVLLRVVMLPVSKWSAKSMAEMQKMAPKMQQIKEEFKHDQKRMQEEMAKIGGLKAMGGCLPMFIQMPVWIGLYGALLVAIQLRHAAFLPAAWMPEGWVFLQDLAAPDALFQWETPWYLPGQDIPLLGWLIGSIQGMLGGGLTSFNILPLLMGAVMYVQQKFTPATAAGPQAEQQKKMMLFMMVFLALVLYSAPAGLCLYIFTSSLLGFIENRFLRKRWTDAAKAAKAAPADEPKPAPSKEVKQQSLVSGRDKSLGERAESWIKQRMGSPQDKGAKKGRKRRK